MKFYEIVDKIIALLHSRGRLSYRALTVEFDLDDNSLVALKEELIETQGLAVDKDGKMLVWTGGKGNGESGQQRPHPSTQHPTPSPRSATRLPYLSALLASPDSGRNH